MRRKRSEVGHQIGFSLDELKADQARISSVLRARQQVLESALLQATSYLEDQGVGGDAQGDFGQLVTRISRIALLRDGERRYGKTTAEEVLSALPKGPIAESVAKTMNSLGLQPREEQMPETVFQVAKLIVEKSRLFNMPLPQAIAGEIAKQTTKMETSAKE